MKFISFSTATTPAIQFPPVRGRWLFRYSNPGRHSLRLFCPGLKQIGPSGHSLSTTDLFGSWSFGRAILTGPTPTYKYRTWESPVPVCHFDDAGGEICFYREISHPPAGGFEMTALTEHFDFQSSCSHSKEQRSTELSASNLPVIPTKGGICSSKRFLIHEIHFFDRNNSCYSIPAGSRSMVVSPLKPRATLPPVVLPRAETDWPFRPKTALKDLFALCWQH